MNYNMELTDNDWNEFEQKFNEISRNDVVNVQNIFRSPEKLFVRQDDLEQWNQNNRSGLTIYSYRLYGPNGSNRWVKLSMPE